MYAIEFRTEIKDGMIEIPEKYRNKLKYSVRVILLAEDVDDAASDMSDMIEKLLESPVKMNDFSI